MAFVGDGNAGLTDENIGGKFFANPNKVTTFQSGGNGDRIFDENVYHNVDTGELYKESPINDPNKIFDDQPGSFAGDSASPTTKLVPLSSTGDNLATWGAEFDNLPQGDFGVDSNIDGSGLQGASALSPGKGSSPNTTASSPPTPPSTRPYIWKYQ